MYSAAMGNMRAGMVTRIPAKLRNTPCPRCGKPAHLNTPGVERMLLRRESIERVLTARRSSIPILARSIGESPGLLRKRLKGQLYVSECVAGAVATELGLTLAEVTR